MKLSGIPIFLLLLLQYDEVLCRHDGHFATDLKLFQDSLAARLYDDTFLDPREDDDEIEDIIDSIIDEADQRLRSHRSFEKRSYDDEEEESNDREYVDYVEEEKEAYREALKGAYNDIVRSYRSKEKRDHKRDIKEEIEKRKVKIDGKKRSNDELLTRFMSDSNDEFKKRANIHEAVEGNDGNNNQVAAIQVDNTYDAGTDFDEKWSKVSFMEVSSTKTKPTSNNSALYAHKSGKSPPHQKVTSDKVDRSGLDKISFIAVVIGCCVAGVAGIALASFCWYKLRSETQRQEKGSVYKSTSLKSRERKISSDEEKLARGAEVFHYLHAKKQMQQMDDPNHKGDGHSINESTDDDDDEDTVYECPGLAPPGDMKVVNPLFSDAESHYSDNPSIQSTPSPPAEEK